MCVCVCMYVCVCVCAFLFGVIVPTVLFVFLWKKTAETPFWVITASANKKKKKSKEYLAQTIPRTVFFKSSKSISKYQK